MLSVVDSGATDTLRYADARRAIRYARAMR